MIDPAALPPALPDVRAFLEWLNAHPGPRLHEVEPAEARRMNRRLHARTEPDVGPLSTIRDMHIPRKDGTRLPIRLFDRQETRGSGPALLFYHGGGFVVGDLDTHAALCAELARQLDLPVFAIDYALAPEQPWPAAPDDAERAARAIAERPEITGLILVGDSAGGTLVIVTALALRDRPAAAPVLAQWPIYPAVRPGTRSRSFDTYGEGYMLTRKTLAWFFAHYAADVRHWRGTPIRTPQTGLPPTLVTTAQLDPLADQGRSYAEFCERDGVRTLFREAPGQIHGFMTLRHAIPSANEELHLNIGLLKSLLS